MEGIEVDKLLQVALFSQDTVQQLFLAHVNHFLTWFSLFCYLISSDNNNHWIKAATLKKTKLF